MLTPNPAILVLFCSKSEEINEYYEKNSDDFILPFNLVRAIYAKIPEEVLKLDECIFKIKK